MTADQAARWSLLLAIGLTGCGGDGAGAGAGAHAAGPRRTAPVQRGTVAPRVLMTGELRAAASVDLSVPRTDAWELSIRWMAEDGALVAAGERVLEFDNSAFTSQLAQRRLAVLQAAMDLRSGQDVARLATADKEAALAERRIAVDKARLLASVPADLLPGRTAQERQLELTRALAALATAQTELAAHKQASALDLRVKQIALTKAQSSIDDATRAMAELVLTAPRAGVVAVADHPWEGRRLQVGDSVQPGWPVVTLPDTAQGLEVRAELSDVDDGKVEAGQAARCVLDAYPEVELPCKITAVTPVARAEGRQTLRKVFDVTLTLEAQPDGAGAGGVQARPGMSVKVVVTGPAVEALVVPRGAVVLAAVPAGAAGGGRGRPARVRLARGGVRDVELGACDAQACAVAGGLDGGEVVVIGGGS